MGVRRAWLMIQTHPVMTLHNEWIEELYCPACGVMR
jgi:hypothetical protein